MSARDDYPGVDTMSGVEISESHYWDMINEIDTLRAKKKADDIVFKAINQLVSELTAHADTMRQLLHDLEYAGVTDCLTDQTAVERAINAYDRFIIDA